VFAKVLSSNDDSGRHGVLVPMDAYAFFPDFRIGNEAENATLEFPAFDVLSRKPWTLAYKYYQRYPERRITRLCPVINDRTAERRIVLVLHARHEDGTSAYYFDCAASGRDGRFQELFATAFGDKVVAAPGIFVLRAVDAPLFAPDKNLRDLLTRFDVIRDRGWVNSLREGDTGIGYTFETLLGIRENNDRRADFNGIEIKCKSVKEGSAFASGKINLFQQGPVWLDKRPARERIRAIGKRGSDGLFTCHSQVTTTANNLGLALVLHPGGANVDLRRRSENLAYWALTALEERIREKHARAAVVKASARTTTAGRQFRYDEFVYCERPTIERFVTLVRNRNIVFEFLMSERADGSVRNHGYPWRLIREELLDQLFAFQIKLR
jgi:hypothetical protein